jgi:hypothetical protein
MGRLAALKAAADAAAADRQMQFNIGDALAKVEALKAAMSGMKMGGIDMSALNASLMSIKSKMQSLGIADIADVNVQPGRLMTQLQLIKRLINQAGISDVLDFNLTPATLAGQLDKLGHVAYDIPIKFDLSRMPQLGQIGTERIPLIYDLSHLPQYGKTMPILKVPANIDVKEFTQAGETMSVLRIPSQIDVKSIVSGGPTQTILKGLPGIDLSNVPTAGAFNAIAQGEDHMAQSTIRLGSALRNADQGFSPLMQSMLRMAGTVGEVDKYMSGFGNIMDMLAMHGISLADILTNYLVPGFSLAVGKGLAFGNILGNMVTSGAISAAVAMGKLNDSVSKGEPMWVSANNLWFGLGGKLQLFGGALSSLGLPKWIAMASGLHMLTDGIIEVGATLIPAAVGLGAFAVSAIDATNVIQNHFVNMDKVIDMTNQSVYPLTGAFSRMNEAAKPQVYVLLGEGLQIVNHNAGTLQGIAQGAGKALDDLGARFTYAMDSGNGFSQFTRNSSSDLAGWGNLIGNIGGILGNFLKQVPGYAEVLLNMAGATTHFIESITGSGIGQAVLGIGLAAHGFLLYAGLIGTGASVLISKTLPMLGSAFGLVAKGIGSLGFNVVADEVGMFGSSITGLSSLPWGWITIAAAGIGFLVYQLVSAKSAAQQFADAVQKTITSVKLDVLGTTLSADALNYADALAKATDQTKALQKATGTTHLEMIGHNQVETVTTYSDATYTAMNNVADYGAALRQVQGDQAIYNANLAQANKVFGTSANSLEALTNAGITTAQMLTTSKQQMAENIIQAQAYNDAIKAVTNGTGQYGAAMNALSGPEQFMGDMLKNIQQITQAQDTLMQTVTGSETSFNTFALGQETLASNFGLTAAQAQGLTHHLGDLTLKSTTAGAVMGGLNQASLTLSQSFYQQVGNAQKVIDALEQGEMPANKMTAAVGALAGQLVPFAQNDEAARATLVAMINDAIGPGTVSLQSLNTWVKQNATSMDGLNSIIEQATVKTGTLANVLQNQLNIQFDAALLKSSGASKAVQTLADAITNTGDSSVATTNARVNLINDLIKTGMSSQDATTYVDGLQKKIDGMHGSQVTVGVNTNGYTVTQTLQQMIDSLHGKTIYVGVQAIGATQLATGMLNGLFATGGIVGGIPYAASGGHRSGLTMVGELGPELVRLPAGSQVYPHGVTPGYANQGGGWDGSAMDVNLVVSSMGQSSFEKFMLEMIRNFVRVKGNGNVQTAFGHK